MLLQSAFRELLHLRDIRNVPWLDFCRSMAILLVLGSHMGDFGFAELGRRYFDWGWTGVDLFFVLSGFLIAKQLWTEIAYTRNVRVGRFLLKRGFRIWPLYYASIGCVLLLDLISRKNPGPLLSDAFCLSDYFHNQVPGSWSLSIEEQFYLALPLLLLLLRKLPPKALLGLPLAWLAVLALVRGLTANKLVASGGADLFAHAFHMHTDGLAIGVILAWLAVFRRDWWRYGWGRISIPLVCILQAGLEHKFHSLAFSFTSLGVLYGGVVIAGLRIPLLSRLTNQRIWYVISRLSFGSYLNNLILAHLVDPLTHAWVARHAGNWMLFGAWFTGFVLVSNAVAFVSYSYIERPFLVRRDRWLQKKQAAAPLAVVPLPQQA